MLQGIPPHQSPGNLQSRSSRFGQEPDREQQVQAVVQKLLRKSPEAGTEKLTLSELMKLTRAMFEQHAHPPDLKGMQPPGPFDTMA